MILHFRTQDTNIQCGATMATLTGRTFGGQAIQGSDPSSREDVDSPPASPNIYAALTNRRPACITSGPRCCKPSFSQPSHARLIFFTPR